MSLLLLAIGLLLLGVGAEGLVRGASRLALRLGISRLVVGLTVVAFGTSAPEAAVSVGASLAGQPDLALGNVLGSNIFNVLFILGASALITPLAVARRMVQIDVPIMIGASILVLVMALDGRVSRLDGALLVAGIVAFTLHAIRSSRAEGAAPAGEPAAVAPVPGLPGLLLELVLIGGGLVLLVVGARIFVSGATELARALGVSDLVIGLTVVAAGTSLPEVATSIVAALRRESDIAVANVLGSNVFNLLGVLGLAALVSSQGVPVAPAALRFDVPVMLAVSAACLPIFFARHLLARWEGALFLGYYVAYVLYLFLDSTGHDALPAFSAVMLEFVLPLTVVTIGLLAVRGLPGAARRR